MSVEKNTGFTLIEVLVALLVLSVGLLGVAAMQLKALQSSHVAYQRSVATLAAQDAVDRLWRATAEGGGGCLLGTAVDVIETEFVSNWGAELPGLADPIQPDTTPGCRFVIDVRWVDERFEGETDAGGDNAVFTLKYRTRVPGA